LHKATFRISHRFSR